MDEFRLERDEEVLGDRSRNSRPWNESVRDARSAERVGGDAGGEFHP
jgi:hypothetical protein